LQRFFQFIGVFNIWISVCTAFLCLASFHFLAINTYGWPVFALSLLGTLLFYNFYYYRSNSSHAAWRERFEGFPQAKQTMLVLMVLSAILISPFAWMKFKSLLAMPLSTALQLLGFFLLIVLLPFLYSYPLLRFLSIKSLNQYGLLKPIVLAISWTFFTIGFPIAWETATPPLLMETLPKNSFLGFLLVRLIWLLLLSLLFDVRDREMDAQSGITTWPQILRMPVLKRLLLALLAIYFVLVLWLLPSTSWAATILHYGTCLMAVWCVLICHRKHSRCYYLFVVDSLLILQAVVFLL
jgi:hypothetical protein